MRTTARSITLRVSVVALSFAAAFGAWEIYLRIWAPVGFRAPAGDSETWRGRIHRASSIEGLRYELAPNQSDDVPGMHVATNSLGMRGPELRPRTPRTVRIAVVGDSYTFGYGVEMEDTFSYQLEEMLTADEGEAEGARRFEVVNLGVGGYSTRDEALVLEHKALALEPDLIILAYALNDPEIDSFMPLHVFFDETRWWQHSHALRFIARSLHKRRIETLGGGNYTRHLYGDQRRWQSVVDGLERMSSIAREASVPILMVVFPCAIRCGDWKEYGFRDIHARVVNAGFDADLEVLDLLPVFEQYEPLDLRVSDSDEHPSRYGHAVTADAIRRRIRETPELAQAIFGP